MIKIKVQILIAATKDRIIKICKVLPNFLGVGKSRRLGIF